MRPDGIQDEDDEYKDEKSHVRSMTEECTSKAANTKASSTKRVSIKAAPAADGTLSRQNVVKLDSTTNRIKTALSTMEEQLACATTSTYIAPQLISTLSMVKTELYAEASSLTLYKENNTEDDTGTFIQHAKAKLESALRQFSVLKKLLKAEQTTIKAACAVTDSRMPEEN